MGLEDVRKKMSGRVTSPDGVRLKFGDVVLGERHAQRMGQPLPPTTEGMPVKTAGMVQKKKK